MCHRLRATIGTTCGLVMCHRMRATIGTTCGLVMCHRMRATIGTTCGLVMCHHMRATMALHLALHVVLSRVIVCVLPWHITEAGKQQVQGSWKQYSVIQQLFLDMRTAPCAVMRTPNTHARTRAHDMHARVCAQPACTRIHTAHAHAHEGIGTHATCHMCANSLHATADVFGALKASGDEPDPAAAAAVGLPEGEECKLAVTSCGSQPGH